MALIFIVFMEKSYILCPSYSFLSRFLLMDVLHIVMGIHVLRKSVHLGIKVLVSK